MADDSVNFIPQESIHIETPPQNNFSKFNLYRSGIKIVNQTINYKYVNVLGSKKSSSKFVLNNQFQDFLNTDKSNCNVIPIAFLGPKKIGKSFLLDNILNFQTGQIRRIMSRNNEELVNTPTYSSYAYDNSRIIYLDNNGNPTPALFLWLYFISGIIVYNLSPNSQNQQATLFECLMYVNSNLKSGLNQMSLPQLIIVRRDVGKKQMSDFQLTHKIGQFRLFQPDIIVVHMPYPGNKNVMTKQLIDVPRNELTPEFLTEVANLQTCLQMARPKLISDQTLNPQTFNLVIQSLTKSINNQQQVSPKKIMEYMYETLSIGYYNNYLKCYSEELEKQFINQQPCDKYTMYRKLNNIKKITNKKMDKYSSFGNNPIFQKYKDKLEETIKSKQALVKGVNQAKSREVHQKNCENLVQNLNDQNYEKLIDQYCKSNLDDQKIQVLMQNYEKVLKPKQVFVPPPLPVKVSKASKPPPEVQNLNKQLQQLQKVITVKSKLPPPAIPNIDVVISSIEAKKAQLNSLKQEQEKLAIANGPQFIMNQDPRNPQLEQLQQQKQKLNVQIQKYQKQIQNLKKAKQRKLKQTTLKLQKQLTIEQQNLKKLKNLTREQVVLKSKVISAGNSTQKTCCSIM